MKRLCFFLLLSSMAFGQGGFVAPQQVLKVVNGITAPVPNATITVCAVNAGGIPCSPVLTSALFKDAALTQPLPNPFTADGNGNYQFAASSGTYTVTTTAAGFAGYSYQITLGGGGSGSGVPQVGGNFGSYTFSVSGGTVSAVNNATGVLAFSGTDLAAVFNNVTAANATTGARLFFKNGIYPINSFTADSTSGCSNFGSSGNLLAYALGFPSNSPIANSVQWFIEGEATTVFQGHAPSTTVNTAGVVFNVTAAGVSSVAANSVLAGVWQKPINNCNIADTSNFNNQIYIKNVTLMFPTNQRGNELAFAPYFASSVSYKNVMANFNLTNNAIATGSAPVVGSYNSVGLTSTASGAGNIQEFYETFAVGYNIGYDFQSELLNSEDSTAVYCNFPAWFARSSSQDLHASKIEHFVDQENANGMQFGNNLQPGSRVDFIGLDIELGVANWYARSAVNMVEAVPNSIGGLITYTVVIQNQGIASGQAALFSSGGGLFTTIGSPSFLPQSPAADNFSRTVAATGPGPAWQNSYTFAGANPFTIVSNALTCSSSNCFMSYLAQPANNDQFSKATVNAIDSNSTTLVGVTVNQTTTASVKTFYSYFASHTAAGGTTIGKNVAGVGTALCTQTSVVGVNAGDTLELRHIGTWLYAYRNGVLDGNLGSCNPISDSSNTGGQPGLFQSDVGGSVSETNWSGGSLPTMHGTDSIYNNPVYSTGYNTIGNCAAVGTAANPSVASCTAATVGSVSCAANASTGTCVVNTTAVTANSEIFLNQRADTTTGTRLGVTCNTTKDTNATSPQITAVTAGTSFTFQLGTITTNPECFSYHIVN